MTVLHIGQPAPLFTLEDLEGRPVSLADFRGRLTLVNFWSAECPWVERADRALVQLRDRAALISIACNANEPLDLLRQAALERGLPWVLRDPNQQVADLYGAVTTPHFFLIDTNGLLRYQGTFDDVSFRQRTPTRTYIYEAIEALHAGLPVPVSETLSYGCTIVRSFAS